MENFYMEPPNDGCVGSFVVKPVASIDFNIPSTSKDKGRRNDSKGKIPQKQKEGKDVVTKGIESSRFSYCKIKWHLIQKKRKWLRLTEEN